MALNIDAVVVAIVALGFSVSSFIITLRRKRRLTATSLFGEYMRFGMQYPQFALGDDKMPKQYMWYVAIALTLLEALFLETSKDKSWLKVISIHLCFHKRAIEENIDKYLDAYDKDFIDFIRKEALLRCRS